MVVFPDRHKHVQVILEICGDPWNGNQRKRDRKRGKSVSHAHHGVDVSREKRLKRPHTRWNAIWPPFIFVEGNRSLLLAVRKDTSLHKPNIAADGFIVRHGWIFDNRAIKRVFMVKKAMTSQGSFADSASLLRRNGVDRTAVVGGHDKSEKH